MDQRDINEIIARKEIIDEKFENTAFVKLYTDIIEIYMKKKEGERDAYERLKNVAVKDDINV